MGQLFYLSQSLCIGMIQNDNHPILVLNVPRHWRQNCCKRLV